MLKAFGTEGLGCWRLCSLVPRPHPAIRAGVGFGSGTETRDYGSAKASDITVAWSDK